MKTTAAAKLLPSQNLRVIQNAFGLWLVIKPSGLTVSVWYSEIGANEAASRVSK